MKPDSASIRDAAVHYSKLALLAPAAIVHSLDLGTGDPAHIETAKRGRAAVAAYTASAWDLLRSEAIEPLNDSHLANELRATDEFLHTATKLLVAMNALALAMPDAEIVSTEIGAVHHRYHDALVGLAYDAEDLVESLTVEDLERRDRERIRQGEEAA